MNDLKLIQVTPDQLSELIRDNVRKELKIFIKDFKELQNDPDQLLTTDQTAEFLQVSKATIKNLTKRGILKPYGAGRRNYFKKSEVETALEKLF